MSALIAIGWTLPTVAIFWLCAWLLASVNGDSFPHRPFAITLSALSIATLAAWAVL